MEGKRAACKRSRISWDTICHPKSEGGLGLKELVSWNKACRLQSIWAIITKSGSLWIAWIQEYVLKGKSFWDLVESSTGSWSWNKLLRLRHLVQRFVEWKNGREQWIFLGKNIKQLLYGRR